jgi:hypothetical protein
VVFITKEFRIMAASIGSDFHVFKLAKFHYMIQFIKMQIFVFGLPSPLRFFSAKGHEARYYRNVRGNCSQYLTENIPLWRIQGFFKGVQRLDLVFKGMFQYYL